MLKRLLVCLILILMTGSLTAQELEGMDYGLEETPSTSKYFDLGVGLGLDYGGLGGVKLSGIAFKHLGFFASAGYYLFTAGWNLGIQGFILPADNKSVVRPYGQIMYGVNCGTVVIGNSYYNKIFTGFTPGVGIAVRFGSTRKHGFDVNINVPVKDDGFDEQMDRMEADPNVSSPREPLPITFSVGYHLSL